MTERTEMIGKCQDILGMEGVFFTDTLMVQLMEIIEPFVRVESFEMVALVVMKMEGVDLGVREIVVDEIRDMKLQGEEE